MFKVALITRNRMENLETQSPPNKKKFWQYLIILVVLGLAVNLLLPQISDLTRSWQVVKQMTWWLVGLAVTAEVFSYLSYGYCLHAIVSLHGKKLATPKGALIAMAAVAVSIVFWQRMERARSAEEAALAETPSFDVRGTPGQAERLVSCNEMNCRQEGDEDDRRAGAVRRLSDRPPHCTGDGAHFEEALLSGQ